MHPLTSVLFANTRRLAPERRCSRTVSDDAPLEHGVPVPDLFLEQPLQLVPAVLDPQSVRGVHDPDEGVRLLEVVPPVGPERLLPANIPYFGTISRLCTESSAGGRPNICSICICHVL